MLIEKIYFEATDGIQLFGLLHKNELSEKTINSKEVVLSVHGMTSNCFKKREEIFADEFTNNGIDYFCFNNRGADIIGYYEKIKDGKLIGRIEAGSAKENFVECYYDIKGAILMLLNKGYETIYLQGHSLGSAKSVYTYQKMKQQNEIEILSHIKAVSLLSIVDVPRTTRVLLSEYFDKAIAESQEMVLENKAESLIKREYFLHPICAKNFLLCSELNGELDVAPFGEQDTDLSALNQIDCKLFMCWGKERDMIVQSPEELKNLLETKIKNMNLKVDFIEGTGHNYHFKEKETAQKMITFLRNA